MSNELKIQAFQVSESVCRYQWDRHLFDIESLVLCQSEEQSKRHPLLEKVYALDGVSKISLSATEMKVMTDKPIDWGDYSKTIAQFLRDSKVQSQRTVKEEKGPIKESQEDKQLETHFAPGAESIQKIIDEQISPALAAHGGSVKIQSFKDGILALSFQGGCQGCSQASATLRGGIEQILRDQVPEIQEIVDATEHELGENPYFS